MGDRRTDLSASYAFLVPVCDSSRTGFDLEGEGRVTLALHGVGGRK